MHESKSQRAWRERQEESRDERMARLRREQRALYDGHPISRPRVVGKPSKKSKRQAAKHRGEDGFFRSNQGGLPQ